MSVLKDSKHLQLSLNEIELATNNFNEPIGKGGYGMVYKGELSISEKSTTVAVKRLNTALGQGLKEFLTEIQLHSGQNHKNVVSLLGYCDEGNEKSLIYEYAANGSLDVCLEKKDTILTWRKRLEICLDAARGLNHLHRNSGNKQTIIHRDIKSANILLDENWVAKIADLGLSKLIYESPEGSSIVSNACGTPGYCDPGYYNNGILKKECDVYSFGIVLFEVLCGKLCSPYPNRDNGFFLLSGQSVQKYYKENRMKEIIDPCLQEHMSSCSISKFSEVAYKCLMEDERKRPSMDRVVKELEELLLIQAIEVESLISNSCSTDPISKLRYEKARRIFRRFDVNRDGVLDRDELTNFFHVLGQPLFLSERDGIRKKIEHMNLLKTKQDFKQKYFGPGLFSKAKDFKHKYFGPGASRTYREILHDIILRMDNPSRDHPSPLGSREVTKAIEDVLKLYGDTTNGEKGLTWDGMLRFYDNGADILHDHFELLRLEYKPFDDNEDSSQTMERYEKVKRIFQRFDVNTDGYLDEVELLMFLSFHSDEQDQNLVLFSSVLNFSYLYRGFIEGGKGLSCDGLFQFYSSGIDSLDDDFEKLNLTLKPLDENELPLRYEKVRRIFQRFDINEDGGLNKEEITELLYRQTSESFLVDCIFDLFKGFTNGKKGLTCEGLLHLYEFGVNNGLDDDFKRLRLDLKHLDDREDTLRKKERAEKVRIMFERFDLKGDGGLDKEELGRLLLARNPHVKAREELGSYVDKVFRWYAKYIDGDKGLTCDGLIRTYDHGIDSLDIDFETLGLELRSSIETQNASREMDRSEKVRKIFKRFDFNGDGGLDRKEMASYLVAVNLGDQLSEKKMTSNVNYMFQNLGEFVDGVTGLSCDGLIKYYDHGEDNLDAHFEILKLR